MIETLLLALKWGVFGNAIFMLVWLGLRISTGHEAGWVLLDALIIIASLLVAGRYRDEGV